MSEIKKTFSNLNVLVVDDDPVGLELILTLLKFNGAKTTGASNGAEGLAFARQLKPNFIISDLSMPVMNGWQMIKALKQDRETMNIPIIALTAHAMRGDRERAIAAGCHNYLSKPIDPYKFLDQIQIILDDIHELKQDSNSVSETQQHEPSQENNPNPNR
jgi:CheY-like chemotaxis protein